MHRTTEDRMINCGRATVRASQVAWARFTGSDIVVGMLNGHEVVIEDCDENGYRWFVQQITEVAK